MIMTKNRKRHHEETCGMLRKQKKETRRSPVPDITMAYKSWQKIINSENFRTSFVKMIINCGMCEQHANACYACFKEGLYFFQTEEVPDV